MKFPIGKHSLFTETWDRYLVADKRISRRMRKAGLDTKLLDDVVDAAKGIEELASDVAYETGYKNGYEAGFNDALALVKKRSSMQSCGPSVP